MELMGSLCSNSPFTRSLLGIGAVSGDKTLHPEGYRVRCKKSSSCYWNINTLNDFWNIAPELVQKRLCGPSDPFVVLVGCSGNSPIVNSIFPKMVDVIGKQIMVPNRAKMIWGGGDGEFKDKNRGGNVADLRRELLHQNYVKSLGAVQRADYGEHIPTHERVRIVYGANIGDVEGNPMFGGFVEDCKGGWEHFTHYSSRILYGSNRMIHVSPKFLPTKEGPHPVAATAAYLSLIPALTGTRRVVLVVVPRAGVVTLAEIQYSAHLIRSKKLSSSEFQIYVCVWKGMTEDMTHTEKKRTAMGEILAVLDQLSKDCPSNVVYLDVERTSSL